MLPYSAFLLIRAVPVLLLLLCSSADAHRRDLSYVAVSEEGRVFTLKIDLDPHDTPLVERLDRDGDGTLTEEEVSEQSPLLEAFTLGRISIRKPGASCVPRSPVETRYFVDVQMWHVNAIYDCPDAAADFTVYLGYVDALGRGHRAMLKVVSDGRVRTQTVIEPRRAIIEPRTHGVLAIGARFTHLGVHHIFDGLDHLAFVLALILAATSVRRALLLLSVFTVAHSVSLALSAFDIVRLPERPVEVTIALSIAVVAFEALRSKESLWLRLCLTFGFGLIHGLGFAAVLADALFASAAFTWSLTTFNLGIELGQAWLVFCVLPGLLSLRGARHFSWQLGLWCLAPLAVGYFASWTNAAALAVFLLLVIGLYLLSKTRPNAAKLASFALGLCGLVWAAQRLLATA